MTPRTRTLLCARLLITTLAAVACSDGASQAVAPDETSPTPSRLLSPV